MAGKRHPRRGFGAVRVLPSGRVQASYIGPDLTRHVAPTTFPTRMDAEGWIAAERRLLDSSSWQPPSARSSSEPGRRVMTLDEFAADALNRRRVRGEPLRPTTLRVYRSIYDRVISPDLGHLELTALTTATVNRWYDDVGASCPTQRARAYGILHSLLTQAIEEGHLATNPCHIRGAAKARRARRITVATPAEVSAIAAEMPENLRLLVLLAGWCGLRFGELVELRRSDIDIRRGTVTIARAYVRVDGKDIVGKPKTAAGTREVAIPPHLLPAVDEHLTQHVKPGPRALLFPRADGQHLTHTTFTKTFVKARSAAGRPDLRLHDLRHSAAVLAAQTGATTAELMARLGHSTPAAAMIYQHAARGRDAQIAVALSRMATAERN